jgi:hypothetical protein
MHGIEGKRQEEGAHCLHYLQAGVVAILKVIIKGSVFGCEA